MAERAISLGAIWLNGFKYRTRGPVIGQFLDPFPGQITIGDPSYDNRIEFSSWQHNDLRGGIGVEEMDEKIDMNRCWFTNGITQYRNHLLPPRKATAISLPSMPVPAITNAGFETASSGWSDGARSNTHVYQGSYSWLVQPTTTPYQDIAWTNNYRNMTFTFQCMCWWDGTGSGPHISINDGVGTTDSAQAAVSSGWDTLTVTRKLDASATRLRIELVVTGASAQSWYDTASFPVYPALGTILGFANFNGNKYLASGNVLLKMASDRTSYTIVNSFTTTIKAIIPSLNNRLYIYLGNTPNYWWMDTSEVFTESDSGSAYWGFQFDAKLWKISTTGATAYSVDPDAGSPTWTDGGKGLEDTSSQIQGFMIGRDASGTETPYAATKSIIKAYDNQTPQWVDTEVRLPSHPNGGKGATYLNGKLYFSYGLAVKEYNPETGSLIDMGLTVRDGLPVEYNGEIVKLCGDSGSKGMFASIDASQTSGNSKSGLYAYDGIGWHCWWTGTANDGAMNDIIVSSVASTYAVYWDCGGTIYYIDIPRGIDNPDKITQNYATAGFMVTPWFDAGNPVALKLAKVLATDIKGITTTETVVIKYRLDHLYTDLSTGWTTIATLNSVPQAGYNEVLFAEGAGLSFKAIQFRADFVTPGSTARSDVQSLVLYFRKRTGSTKIRQWELDVIVDDEPGSDGNMTAKQKVANLQAAITSGTDSLFLYHPNYGDDESFYVSVNGTFSEETGDKYRGSCKLVLVRA